MAMVTGETMPDVGKRKALDAVRNEAVRAYLRSVVREDFDGNASATAKALDMSQPALSDLLSGKRGFGLSVIDAIAHLRHVSIDVVLGRAPAPTDRYPNKYPVMASAEFASASETVRGVFVELEPAGGDKSVVAWSVDLLALVQAERLGQVRSRGGERLLAEPAEQLPDNVVPLLPLKS